MKKSCGTSSHYFHVSDTKRKGKGLKRGGSPGFCHLLTGLSVIPLASAYICLIGQLPLHLAAREAMNVQSSGHTGAPNEIGLYYERKGKNEYY
jgi:hypothetical protein